MMPNPPRQPWVQVHSLSRARVLLILPCNAAACVGNYFRAEVYRASGWNTWREADSLLHDVREEGLVAFAAVDSSILETAPDDPRGAIVLETEMERAMSPDGEDWGAPCWRWWPFGIPRPQLTVTLGKRRGLKIGRARFSDSPFLRLPVSCFRPAAPVLVEGTLDHLDAGSRKRIGVLRLMGGGIWAGGYSGFPPGLAEISKLLSAPTSPIRGGAARPSR